MMDKNRRKFLLLNLLGYPGLLINKISPECLKDDIVQSRDLYVMPRYFDEDEVLKLDLFGDLIKARQGSSDMTMGSGETLISAIENVDDWNKKSGNLKELHDFILGIPPIDYESELSVKIEKEISRDDIIERHVSYNLDKNERVISIMLLPKNISKPLPTILTIHPTTKYGKEQTVGRGAMENGELTEQSLNRAYGLELAKRGYITFSPDLLGAGDRIFPGKRPFDNQPFIKKYPQWSGTGKDLWDLQKALDVIESFPEVDSNRIGSIGHSQGGGLTGRLLAIDKRVKVGVSNCGIWPSRIRKNPFNIARTDWWTGIPSLRPFLFLGKNIPIDSHEIIALSAPKPHMIVTALNDNGYDINDEKFTRFAWENLETNVRKIYKFFNADNNFKNILHLNGHDFPKNIREKSYKFIDNNL